MGKVLGGGASRERGMLATERNEGEGEGEDEGEGEKM